jgi:hypothetical protein
VVAAADLLWWETSETGTAPLAAVRGMAERGSAWVYGLCQGNMTCGATPGATWTINSLDGGVN